MNGQNGGTTAPGGRGRQRPGQGQPPVPGQPPTPGTGQGGGGAPAPAAGVSGGGMVGPGGRQLSARVSSGAITQEQATKTMQQRQTLAKALGPDWREKLSVGGKSFAQVNAGLKKNPGNPKLAALRKRLVANRSTLLANAKKKPGAGSEEGE